MPGPASKEVSSFSGRTGDLLDFFIQFEDLANSYDLIDAEKCHALLRYVDSATKQLWPSLPEYTLDYKTFKTTIFEEHPSAEKSMQYSYRDLERIVIAFADLDMTAEADFSEFVRQFRPVATWLVKNKKLSEQDRDQFFWQGNPQSAQREILGWLEHNIQNFGHIEYPAFADVIKAGRKVLESNRFDVNKNNPIPLRLRAARNPIATASVVRASPSGGNMESGDDMDAYLPANREVCTRTVHFKAAPVSSPSDEIDELTQCLHGLKMEDATYAGCYMRLVCLAPTAAQFLVPPPMFQAPRVPV